MAGGGHAVDLAIVEHMRLVRLLSAPDLVDDRDATQRLVLPVVSAHAAGHPVVLACLNRVLPTIQDGVALLAGTTAGLAEDTGARTFPFASGTRPDRRSDCLFPPGGTCEPIDTATVVAALTSLPAWTPLAAEPAPVDPTGPAPVSVDQPRGAEAAHRPAIAPRDGYEDLVHHLVDVAFAWLLYAQPLPATAAHEQFRDLQSAARALGNAAQHPGEQALDLAMATALLEYLHRGRSVGLWRVRWLVGSTDAGHVREVAGLLAATSVLQRHPLRIVAPLDVLGLDEVLADEHIGVEWKDPRSPFVTTSEHLAILGQPPRRELPGFRLTAPQTFDSNVEDLPVTGAAPQQPTLSLGVLLDAWGRPSGGYGVSLDSLNRHMFVCGATGSGKSQTVRQLLEELSRRGVPWLVIEPVKAEYRRMSDRLADAGIPVHVIRLGAPDQPPCMLNPLEPEQGFNLQTHADMVNALFLAAFEAEEPFPQVLTESLRRTYEALGWDLATGRHQSARTNGDLDSDARRLSYPTLSELQDVADEVIKGIGYGPEVQSNVRGFVKVRVGSLRLGTPGRFFESGHPLDMARLLERNVVVELEDVGNDQDKAFVIGSVLLRLVEHLRVHRSGSDGLRHVTVIEEAHRLLRRPERSGPGTHAIETFAGLLAEVRAYGEGLVVAEQIPTKIVTDVVKNTAVQVMHRLPARDDRELVGAAMNMSPEQMGYVVGVGRGEAAVFAEGMDRPVLVAMRLGELHERDGRDARDATELLAGRRSPWCPQLCWDSPCNVMEMQAAGSWAADITDLDLYVDLVVVSLLRPGGVAVLPAPALADAVQESQGRTCECGVSQLAQAAVLRRHSVLATCAGPTEVLGVLTGFVRDALRGAPAAADGAWWTEIAEPCRLPTTLDDARRIEGYVGGDVTSLGSTTAPTAETRQAPLLALARTCAEETSDAPGERLRQRIADVVVAPPDDLARLLSWCFGWPG